MLKRSISLLAFAAFFAVSFVLGLSGFDPTAKAMTTTDDGTVAAHNGDAISGNYLYTATNDDGLDAAATTDDIGLALAAEEGGHATKVGSDPLHSYADDIKMPGADNLTVGDLDTIAFDHHRSFGDAGLGTTLTS